jgi:hypothetical protein
VSMKVFAMVVVAQLLKKLPVLYGTRSFVRHQVQKGPSIRRSCQSFRRAQQFIFYAKVFLTLHPTCQAGGEPLSAVCYCLFNTVTILERL